MSIARLLSGRTTRRGTVLPILGVCLISLFGFVGLAVDLGMLAVARTQCQNAADVAALAGTRTAQQHERGELQQPAGGAQRRDNGGDEQPAHERQPHRHPDQRDRRRTVPLQPDDADVRREFVDERDLERGRDRAERVVDRHAGDDQRGPADVLHACSASRRCPAAAQATAVSPPGKDIAFVIDMTGLDEVQQHVQQQQHDLDQPVPQSLNPDTKTFRGGATTSATRAPSSRRRTAHGQQRRRRSR